MAVSMMTMSFGTITPALAASSVFVMAVFVTFGTLTPASAPTSAASALALAASVVAGSRHARTFGLTHKAGPASWFFGGLGVSAPTVVFAHDLVVTLLHRVPLGVASETTSEHRKQGDHTSDDQTGHQSAARTGDDSFRVFRD